VADLKIPSLFHAGMLPECVSSQWSKQAILVYRKHCLRLTPHRLGVEASGTVERRPVELGRATAIFAPCATV
jgi:hypothetical protein